MELAAARWKAERSAVWSATCSQRRATPFSGGRKSTVCTGYTSLSVGVFPHALLHVVCHSFLDSTLLAQWRSQKEIFLCWQQYLKIRCWQKLTLEASEVSRYNGREEECWRSLRNRFSLKEGFLGLGGSGGERGCGVWGMEGEAEPRQDPLVLSPPENFMVLPQSVLFFQVVPVYQWRLVTWGNWNWNQDGSLRCFLLGCLYSLPWYFIQGFFDFLSFSVPLFRLAHLTAPVTGTVYTKIWFKDFTAGWLCLCSTID